MYYSSKRQAFLVDQGYAFKVITHLSGIENLPGLAYSRIEERRELLAEVALQNSDAGDAEGDDFDGARNLSFNAGSKKGGKKGAKARRTAGRLSELAGGDGMAYVEYNRSRNKELKNAGPSKFFRKLQREQEKKRKDARDLNNE